MNFPSRILIIDDDPLHLEILERAFMKHGAVTVAKASDGYQAKWLMVEALPPFDLIILDLCLPGFDGFEMLNHFNTSGSDTRFVLLSGMPRHMLDMAETYSEIKGLRLIGTLQKPTSIAELINAVKGHDWSVRASLDAGDLLHAG